MRIYRTQYWKSVTVLKWYFWWTEKAKKNTDFFLGLLASTNIQNKIIRGSTVVVEVVLSEFDVFAPIIDGALLGWAWKLKWIGWTEKRWEIGQKKKDGWMDLTFTSSLNQETKFACWL